MEGMTWKPALVRYFYWCQEHTNLKTQVYENVQILKIYMVNTQFADPTLSMIKSLIIHRKEQP